LQNFRGRFQGIGEASDDHPLAMFAGDPVGCIGENSLGNFGDKMDL